MTRINTIDPVDLLDQHLFIEYREITRVYALHRARKPSEQFPAKVQATSSSSTTKANT